MRRLAAIAVLGLGCSINETGERDVLDGAVDAQGDVAVDVVKDVAPFVCADAGPASCTNAAQFFSPALYAPDRNTACPAGYDTHDLVSSVPSSPSCTCTCNTNVPTCDTTQVKYTYGTGGTCGTPGSYTLNGCTATTKSTFAGEFLEIDPPALLGGCTGQGTATPPSSTNTNVRLCTPQCPSDESMCTSQTGLRACLVVLGQVFNCPPNTPYQSGPFYIGANPTTTTCDNCSCAQSGDCSGSTLHDYTNQSCNQGDQAFLMDGMCHGLTGGQIGVFTSGQIMPVVTNAKCTPSETVAHTHYAAEDVSVCCK